MMADAKFINAPNTLRTAKRGKGRAKLDPKVLQRAEMVVEKIQAEYSDWAEEDLVALDGVLKELKSGGDDQQAPLKTLYRLSLDMKGQGGSFGYRMMSEVAGRLNDFIANRTALLSVLDIEVVEAHIAALHALYRQNVRDDGGKMGTALLIGLDKIVEKANARGQL